jgi:hypothetical protein
VHGLLQMYDSRCDLYLFGIILDKIIVKAKFDSRQEKELSFRYHVLNDSDRHPDSHLMGTVASYRGAKIAERNVTTAICSVEACTMWILSPRLLYSLITC